MLRRLLLSLAVLGLSCQAVPALAQTSPDTARQASMRLPLAFEENQGQSAEGVRYLAHGGKFTLFLTDSGPAVSFSKDGAEPANIQLHWLGAQDTKAVAEEKQAGVANYFVGRDEKDWHTNVPTFARVRYREVYPGVDVLFHGSNHDLEYDVVVKPGADPRQVGFRIDGAKTSLDGEGNLVLHTASGDLLQHRPVLYQVVDGQKKEVQGSYDLEDGRVDFKVGGYDRSRELVIDPTLTYSTFVGGNNIDFGWSVAIDSSNSAYVFGDTGSTNYPIKNAYQSTRKVSGGTVLFITKFAPNGGSLVYSTYFGGACQPGGLAVDRFGAAYFDAYCDPKNVPGKILGSPDMTTFQGVIAKLNPAGNTLAYSLIFGGQNGAVPQAIALDSTQHAYATGTTASVDFPTTAGAYQASSGGSSNNSFVVKAAADGSGFAYSTYFPGGFAYGIAVDKSGAAYITGNTDGNIPTTPGAFQTTKPAFTPCDPGDKTCQNSSDAFVTKFNPAGSALVYSTYVGGKNEDEAYGITVDANNDAYITGQTFSTNFPTTLGAFRRTLPCCFNLVAFVTKLNSTGSALSYSTFLGGSGGSSGKSIAVNTSGQAFVTGSAGTNFPLKNPIQSTYGGNGDSFVSKLYATGGGLLWSTYLGGSNDDFAQSIRLDGAGNPYITGWTSSADFQTTSGAYRPHPQGQQDGFLVKITN